MVLPKHHCLVAQVEISFTIFKIFEHCILNANPLPVPVKQSFYSLGGEILLKFPWSSCIAICCHGLQGKQAAGGGVLGLERVWW